MEIPLEPIFAAFGLAADVTTPDAESPITTTVVWSSVETDDVPGRAFQRRAELQRREPIRVAALRRSAVPAVPRGTVIVAPEVLGGEVKTWRVDGLARVEVDMIRVTVVLVEDET